MATRREQSDASDSYFGSVAGTLATRLMWAWVNRRLHVRQGADHGKDAAWDGQHLEANYRGWYDPTVDELFLVGPKRADNQPPPATRRIPRILDRALLRRFGDTSTYRVF